jgi:Holliday junction resolvase
MTGSDYERALAKRLAEDGYHVIRAPASGSATTRALPDLAWGDGERVVCAELKTTGQNVAYFDAAEVTALREFAVAFNAASRLVARFKGDTDYYCIAPEQARQTDSGRYAVDRDMEMDAIL